MVYFKNNHSQCRASWSCMTHLMLTWMMQWYKNHQKWKRGLKIWKGDPVYVFSFISLNSNHCFSDQLLQISYIRRPSYLTSLHCVHVGQVSLSLVSITNCHTSHSQPQDMYAVTTVLPWTVENKCNACVSSIYQA